MMIDLTACMLVLAGGFMGGVLRYAIAEGVARRVAGGFPWGTLVVNVSGDIVIGGAGGGAGGFRGAPLVETVRGEMVRGGGAGGAPTAGGVLASAAFREFAVVGLLGGYTTVSAFALQTLSLAIDGQHRRAVLNVVLSAGLGLFGVAAGFWLAARLLA